jgi:hypothetical protein
MTGTRMTGLTIIQGYYAVLGQPFNELSICSTATTTGTRMTGPTIIQGYDAVLR